MTKYDAKTAAALGITLVYCDLVDNSIIGGNVVVSCPQCGATFAFLDHGEQHDQAIQANGGKCPQAKGKR